MQPGQLVLRSVDQKPPHTLCRVSDSNDKVGIELFQKYGVSLKSHCSVTVNTKYRTIIAWVCNIELW